MLAIAFVAAMTIADSSALIQDIDADTLEFSAEIDALDWSGSTPYAIRFAAVQRDTAFNSASYRLDISHHSTSLGAVLQSPENTDLPTGFWLQSHVGGMQVTLGDFGLFAGSGLLLGTASMGMRSTRSVQLPRSPIPYIRPWRARYRDPAIRGGALSTRLDSGSIALCIAGGTSIHDSITSLAAALSYGGEQTNAGLNLHVRESIAGLSASAWLQTTSGPHTMVAEMAGSAGLDLSLQAAYKYSSSIMRFAASLWSCSPKANLPLGSLMSVTSAPKNTWGLGLGIGQTQRSFVGWDVLLVIRGSATRTFDNPFPSSEYALRAEVRQSITSLLRITWRAFAMRDDDGHTLEEVRTQQHIHRIGLQSTIERIIRPSLRWRARADVRWLLQKAGLESSTSLRIEVLWQPTSAISLRLRALHFAAPSYLIASRTIEYVTQDLQRMIYGSGYGLRCSMSAVWRPSTVVQCALLAGITTSGLRPAAIPEVWLAISGQILPVRDRHQLPEESAEL